jgi:hypothetical protein
MGSEECAVECVRGDERMQKTKMIAARDEFGLGVANV